MEWKSKGIFFSVWVLLFVLLVGCTTVPKTPKDPYLGYVYNQSIKGDTNFKQDGVESALKGYKEQIASEVLEKRRKNYKAYDKDKSLDKTKRYIRLLEEPISIEVEQWERAVDDSLSKKEKKALLAYWEANKPLSINGSKSLSDWSIVLLGIRTQYKIDKDKAKGIESKIKSLRKGKYFRDALEQVDELRPYKPMQADALKESLKKDASDYWVSVRMSEIGELRSAKVYDDEHEQQVLALYAKLCDDARVFGNRKDFNGVFTGWVDLLGENWRKRIVKKGESKEYWEAYEFARERYRGYVDTLKYDKSYREGLRLKIGKGYLEILDNAIRNYSDLASNAYKLKSLSGKAYVYCCMAKEMYDFATVANLGYNEKTETWYKRSSELEKNELVTPLGSRVARRLVIYDFELDMLGLSKIFRHSCLEKYASGNNHALGLEVITDKVSLAQLEDGSLPVEPNDYVVKWSRADFKVKGRYGTPIPKTAYVRTDRIKLVDNPFRKDKSSEFYKLKQVKCQEVDQYSLIESVRGIDLSCNMDVSCLHRGLKETLKLTETESIINENANKYRIITNITATCSLENVFSKKEYYSPDQHNNAIPQDDIPSNHVINLPGEDEFKDALTVSIIQDLENELESLIDMYPIDLLADTDRDALSKYLDSLGTVLFYVANLSSTDAAKRESAGEGYEWLHLRDQIADDTKKWCGEGERWAAIGADEKMIMRSLWEECIKVGTEQDGR